MYKTRKYTNQDKEILNELIDALNNTHIRKTFTNAEARHLCQGHSVKTGANFQKEARQTIYGKRKYQGKVTDSSSTIKYPHILPLFKKFMKSHCPEFVFTTVYVNKNVKCKRHLDFKNVGQSILVGCGDYIGGQIMIYENEIRHIIDIKLLSVMFNGAEYEHRTLPFTGERYSFYFTIVRLEHYSLYGECTISLQYFQF